MARATSAADNTGHAPAQREEPPEPLLKYERVGGHFHAIFKDDSLSCIALHVRYLVVGTYNGNVLLLELDGRFIRRLHQHYKKVNGVCIDETGQFIASCSDDGTVAVYTLFPPSAATSSTTTKPSAASHVSVASTGGEVNIYNYFSPIYCVALEDRYALKRERSFACGGIAGQLLLNRKGWIIDKESTIHEGEGPVHAIQWHHGLVAWANDWGVKVYDADRDTRVTFIERPLNCPPMELCRCHLAWQPGGVLIVGWASSLRVVAFTKGTTGSLASDAYSAEVVASIGFDFFVAGLSPWGTTAVCVLAYRPPGSMSASASSLSSSSTGKLVVEGEGDAAEMPLPEVHVVYLDGRQVAADILNLRGYQRLRAADYKMPTLHYQPPASVVDDADAALAYGADTTIYDAGAGRLAYVCTPKDVVICRLRDVDDRVQFALARRNYKQALDVALSDRKALRLYAFDELVELYIGDLLAQNHYKQAANEIKRLFVGDEFALLWTKYVYVFAQRGQLSAIAMQMPTMSPRLPRVQYEMVLKLFLESDPAQLLEIIRKWPKPRQQRVETSVHTNGTGETIAAAAAAAPEYTETASVFEPLYDAQAWINQLESVVRRRRIAEADASSISVETSYVMEALAELYTATEQYDHALRIYLSQGACCTNKDHAFKLISEHQLWPLVQHKVANLMQIDRTSAVRMLVAQTAQLKIADIVKQLEDDRETLHAYLHELFIHRLSEYNAEQYAPLHEMQVALYTEFAPTQLLRFLQTSNFVPLEKAYTYCSERSPPLWDAMIYILGRMGHHKRALDLILTQMRDINQAIQFVQENDENLWDYLIDLSLTSQENVVELLKFASQHKIDPIKLIRKIPDDMEIDGLKQKLIDIIANYRIQQNLCTGCSKVFESDRVQLLQRQVTTHKRARRVAAKTTCLICSDVLRPSTAATANASGGGHVCVFECGHCYHLPCLEEKMRMWKRSDVVERGDLSALRQSLGCFVCDHSTRAFARTGLSSQLEALAPPARGVTEEQLQRAKDTLQLSMAT